MNQPRVEFDVREDTIPPAPRLIVRSYGVQVYETGMLHGEDPRKVARSMIAAARRLYSFTDEEVAAIKPIRSMLERALQAFVDGKEWPIPDGSTPANEAFRTPVEWFMTKDDIINKARNEKGFWSINSLSATIGKPASLEGNGDAHLNGRYSIEELEAILSAAYMERADQMGKHWIYAVVAEQRGLRIRIWITGVQFSPTVYFMLPYLPRLLSGPLNKVIGWYAGSCPAGSAIFERAQALEGQTLFESAWA